MSIDREISNMGKLYESIKQEDQMIEEGIFDRMGARAAGAGSFLKNVGGNLKNVFTGGQNVDPRQAYTNKKLESIIGAFKKDLGSLFGPQWATQYKDLDKQLNLLTQNAGAANAGMTSTPAAPAAAPATPSATPAAAPAAGATQAIDPAALKALNVRAKSDLALQSQLKKMTGQATWSAAVSSLRNATPQQVQQLKKLGLI